MGIGPETTAVLESLRKKSESDEGDGWKMVYLDNAIPTGMPAKTFRSYLAKLSQHGLYEVVDGFAWGRVKMTD